MTPEVKPPQKEGVLTSAFDGTIIGIWYFSEDISQLEKYGILFGVLGLFLFALSSYQK